MINQLSLPGGACVDEPDRKSYAATDSGRQEWCAPADARANIRACTESFRYDNDSFGLVLESVGETLKPHRTAPHRTHAAWQMGNKGESVTRASCTTTEAPIAHRALHALHGERTDRTDYCHVRPRGSNLFAAVEGDRCSAVRRILYRSIAVLGLWSLMRLCARPTAVVLRVDLYTYWRFVRTPRTASPLHTHSERTALLLRRCAAVH